MVAHRGRGHPRGRGMRGGMFRGRGAFRGRGGGRGNFNGQNRNSVFIPFQPFDLELCQSHFPKVANTPTTDDPTLGEFIIERNKVLELKNEVKTAFEEIFTEVKKALETYSGNLTEENANSLEETRKVGAYSNETIIDGVREFEILATLKSPPKTTDIEAVAVSLTESLPNFNISCEPDSAMIKLENSAGLRCACFLTCVGSKIKTAGDDCINKKVLYKNFDMGKRSRWFEDHCADPNIRVLARLLCDMRVRFKGLCGLSQWAVELLSHYSITKYDEHGNLSALTIQHAFRRCLMLLSSGFFLPGSAGIRDPTERDGRSVHQNFSKNDQDMICATAQTLIRVLMQGAPKKVLGLEVSDVTEEMQVIDGIVVQPSLGCCVEEEEQSIKMES